MNTDREVSRHYSGGNLLSRLNAALAEDGINPDHPSMDALAPYDQFHGRGLEATTEVANLVRATASDHILDIGSGIGGPARYFANRFGCRVTGIDLTPEFCDVARHLTQLLDLEDRIKFEVGNALAMPFADGSFDGAYSMNVSMNIADKSAFYHEIHRVLKPGALGEEREHQLPVDAGGDAARPTGGGFRRHSIAQHSRGSSGVWRARSRDCRARGEAAEPRGDANGPGDCEPGNGERVTRPFRGANHPDRSSRSKAGSSITGR